METFGKVFTSHKITLVLQRNLLVREILVKVVLDSRLEARVNRGLDLKDGLMESNNLILIDISTNRLHSSLDRHSRYLEERLLRQLSSNKLYQIYRTNILPRCSRCSLRTLITNILLRCNHYSLRTFQTSFPLRCSPPCQTNSLLSCKTINPKMRSLRH